MTALDVAWGSTCRLQASRFCCFRAAYFGHSTPLCRHVIVIPRLTQRLADARQRLAEVGVAYELLNGTDGRQPIPAPLLDMYLGPRLRDLVLRQHDQHWVMMTANLLSNVQVRAKGLDERVRACLSESVFEVHVGRGRLNVRGRFM